MSPGRCRPEQVDAWLAGELSAAEAAALHLHLSACKGCANELAWLRAEHALVAQRQRQLTPPPPTLWASIQRRLSEEAQLRAGFRWRARWLELSGAVLCAAVLMVMALGAPRTGAHDAPGAGLSMCVGDRAQEDGAEEPGATCGPEPRLLSVGLAYSPLIAGHSGRP